jgi:KAP family P-loop domain
MKAPFPHLASIADRPISTVGEDSLGRRRFAKAIGDLILSAPTKETLRIGIYGGWGEGKTSVLRLIETALRAKGHPVVWITPWATASREALVADLVKKLASELGISLSVSARQWARPLKALASGSGKVAELDPRLKAAESLLGDGIRSVLSKATKQQVEIVFEQIRKKLGDRKLVVMVDDLDRLRPERVPEILLLLREALDQPNYFYLLALDPVVVTKGLAALHAGWDTSADFLEKIVELPRQLPAPTDEEVRAFIHEQIDRSDDLLRRDVLAAISPALSRNPRKLKLLLRYLSSLSGVTSRLADDEIDWESLYLCQMLRVEFSDEALRLAADDATINDLEHGSMHDRLKSKSDVSPAAPLYETYAPTSEAAARRFKMIAGEIRKRGRWKGRYGMRECFLLPDDPPLITWKEVDQFINEFAAASSADGQKQSVHDALIRIDAPVARARGALFDRAVEYRQAAMSEAVDAKTEHKIQAT